MSFLDWIADWAEEHIPLVGGWIAELVRKLQSAIEGAWGWIEDEVSWIRYTWVPHVEGWLSSLSDSLSSAWARIRSYIEPAISALQEGFGWLKDKVANIGNELSNLIRDLPDIIYSNIPSWLKDGAKKALNEIPRLWDSICTLYDNIREGLSNLTSLIYRELDKAKDAVKAWASKEIAKAEEFLNGRIDAIKSEFSRAVAEWEQRFEALDRAFNDFMNKYYQLTLDMQHRFENTILHIDEFLLTALAEFIVKMMTWFLASFIDDLAHLQYDPVEKKVYGRPKNPITHILVWFFEVEKPENPYTSVKPELGVKDVGGGGYVRP